jgi:hypothetical protein
VLDDADDEGETEAEGLTEGETEAEGLGLRLALDEGLIEALGDTLADGDTGISVTSMLAHTLTPFVAPVRLKVWTQNSY